MCGRRGAFRTRRVRLGLLGLLPVLQRLRPRRDAFEIGVGAARARRVARFLSGGFLPAGLLLVASFLALAFALALLLRWP